MFCSGQRLVYILFFLDKTGVHSIFDKTRVYTFTLTSKCTLPLCIKTSAHLLSGYGKLGTRKKHECTLAHRYGKSGTRYKDKCTLVLRYGKSGTRYKDKRHTSAQAFDLCLTLIPEIPLPDTYTGNIWFRGCTVHVSFSLGLSQLRARQTVLVGE